MPLPSTINGGISDLYAGRKEICRTPLVSPYKKKSCEDERESNVDWKSRDEKKKKKKERKKGKEEEGTDTTHDGEELEKKIRVCQSVAQFHDFGHVFGMFSPDPYWI